MLDEIQKIHIKTDREELDIYRLGIFENNMYELVVLVPNFFYQPHIHKTADSKLFTISGHGTIILDDKEIQYGKGDVFMIPKGMRHGFRTATKSLFLSMNNPPILNPETDELDFEYVDAKQDKI